jgi:hypothetical protein
MQEQKKTVKEYKEHFTHWMKKDLSNFREKSKVKQIKSSYGNQRIRNRQL